MPKQVNYSQDIVTPEVRMTVFSEAQIDKLLTAVRKMKTYCLYKKLKQHNMFFENWNDSVVGLIVVPSLVKYLTSLLQ